MGRDLAGLSAAQKDESLRGDMNGWVASKVTVIDEIRCENVELASTGAKGT